VSNGGARGWSLVLSMANAQCIMVAGRRLYKADSNAGLAFRLRSSTSQHLTGSTEPRYCGKLLLICTVARSPAVSSWLSEVGGSRRFCAYFTSIFAVNNHIVCVFHCSILF
jgi:hypothetical protein